MTPTQSIDLRDLCEKANVAFDEHLSQAQASKRIDELKAASGGSASERQDEREHGLVSPDPTGNPGSLGTGSSCRRTVHQVRRELLRGDD